MGLTDNLIYAQQLDKANPQNHTPLDDLNNNLSSMYSSLSNLNGVQTNALMRQNDIQNIINTEADRLQSKQGQIDQAANNQKRIIYANDNNRKVYAAYLKITIVAAITLGIIWFIRVIHTNFGEIIPVFITNVLMIVTVSIGLITMYNYYIGIRARDPYNFDELKFDPPAPLATPSPDPSTAFRLGGIGSLCAGKYCCSPSTTWDPVHGMCIVPEGTEGPKVQSFTTMDSVRPLEAFEDYAKV